MKKNSSNPNLANSLSVKRLGVPQSANRKFQGFDRSTPAQVFTSKIEKIRKRPQQESLEDQYVKGLQDQIGYLEMELKLLKQKEVSKNSQVDQLETFFGDGIPINENILAIKNGFNNCKIDCEKKIICLDLEKKQRNGVIEGLKSRAQRLSQEISECQYTHKGFLIDNGNITHAKVKQEIQLKEEIEQQEQFLRNLRTQNRKLTESISSFQRTKQIEAVSIMKTQSNKFNKLNKIREQIEMKEKQFEKLEAKYEDLKKQEEQKTYVIRIEENNLKLKKKAISLEKQLSSLQIKAEEKRIELEEKLKQRQKQIANRMDMEERLNNVKEDIDKENGLSVQQLERIAKERQIATLEKISQKNKKLSKYVSYYGQLLAKIQDEIEVMGEEKPDLKRQLQAYTAQLKNLEKDYLKEKNRNLELGADIAEADSKIEFINRIVPPAADRAKKNNDKVKLLESEQVKLTQDMKVKEKQLQLIEILKRLSLDEIQVSNSSNESIQDRLIDFMRNWETLARNS